MAILPNRKTRLILHFFRNVRIAFVFYSVLYGQRQKPGGARARRAVAKRSYPTSEVRGSSRECQAAAAQEQLRGGTPRPRSGGAAGRSYPTSEGRGGGREKQPHLQGAVAAQAEKGVEELFHVQGQKGWR